jgi:glycyl-tRNA synthetase beta subunit
MPQVQILVEKDKNVNFKRVLELAASVQPTKVEANTVEDVYQFVTRRLEQLLVRATFVMFIFFDFPALKISYGSSS